MFLIGSCQIWEKLIERSLFITVDPGFCWVYGWNLLNFKKQNYMVGTEIVNTSRTTVKFSGTAFVVFLIKILKINFCE